MFQGEILSHLQDDDGGRDELRVAGVAAEVEAVADGLQRAGAVLVRRGAGVLLQRLCGQKSDHQTR